MRSVMALGGRETAAWNLHLLTGKKARHRPSIGSEQTDALACIPGGDVTVASEPGEGSMFTVRLPGGEHT
jgi:hypothetical protein